MRVHRQTRAFLVKPAAAVTIMQLNKIHGPVVFIGPFAFLQAPDRDVHQN
jgi:hypothetical protein